MTDGLDVCYENLAIAVTRLAVEDYIAERKKLDQRPDDPYAAGKIMVIRKFFASGAFGLLAGTDADSFCRRLDKLARKKNKRIKLKVVG